MMNLRRSMFQALVLLLLITASAAAHGEEVHERASPPAVYVSKILEGSVVAIDVATDAVVRFVHTGSAPAEIGMVEATQRAYVADLVDGTISVIDTIAETVITTIDVIFSDGFESGDTSAWSAAL